MESPLICSNCEEEFRLKSLSTSALRQIYVYLVSFLLAPLGFWYGYKYLKINEEKSRRIGLIAIILTLISLVISYLVLQSLMVSLNQVINESQQEVKNLGF